MLLCHLSITDIKKISQCLIFFCKNKACVNCGTHKRHNHNLVTVAAWTSIMDIVPVVLKDPRSPCDKQRVMPQYIIKAEKILKVAWI